MSNYSVLWSCEQNDNIGLYKLQVYSSLIRKCASKFRITLGEKLTSYDYVAPLSLI